MDEGTRNSQPFWCPTSPAIADLQGGRRPHASAAPDAAQRPDRPDNLRPPRTHRQAHRRRLDHRVPQRGRRRSLRDRNTDRHDRAQAGLPPEKRIEFRVGVHLGDVVEEADGDLMGDGVNIAARLEGIAKPGAICLSEDAYRQVKGRLDLKVSDLGLTQLKNIAEPVRVYAFKSACRPMRRPRRRACRRTPCGERAEKRFVLALSALASPSCSPLARPPGILPRVPIDGHRIGAADRAAHLSSSCCRSPIFPGTHPKTISPMVLPRISPLPFSP